MDYLFDTIIVLFWLTVGLAVLLLALGLRHGKKKAKRWRTWKYERAVAERERDLWISENFGNYAYSTNGSVVQGLKGAYCVVALESDGKSLRIASFDLWNGFQHIEDVVIPLKSILQIEVAHPAEIRSKTKTQLVPIVSSQKKSPVARGLVGGVVFGPAGLVLGAASGVANQTTTKIEKRQVSERVEMTGDPQLVIGTSLPDRPILKLKFSPPRATEEWLYRVRAALSA